MNKKTYVTGTCYKNELKIFLFHKFYTSENFKNVYNVYTTSERHLYLVNFQLFIIRLNTVNKSGYQLLLIQVFFRRLNNREVSMYKNFVKILGLVL